MTPQEILDKARSLIQESSRGNADKWWYINRFVFARLQLDERKTKTDVKKWLLESNQPCYYWGKLFLDGKNIHLHRLDAERGYSRENCVLMHQECHEKFHIENPHKRKRGRPPKGHVSESIKSVLTKKSKRYDTANFFYWWDISPNFLQRMDKFEYIVFLQKDTDRFCSIPTIALKGFLTKNRRTTRGQGNWGIKVLKKHENELAFEPGSHNEEWLFMPVVWQDKIASFNTDS